MKEELVHTSFTMAREKGWYEPGTEKTPLEAHMLIVSEIAEATEEARKGTPPIYVENNGICPIESIDINCFILRKGEEVTMMKPEGELIELADAIIRIADYCGYRGWDLEGAIKMKLAYNESRPARHGGKLK